MPVNPGDRHPGPTPVEQAERAVRGTIFFLAPILDGLLVALAFALLIAGLTVPALVVAFIAGRFGVR
jgi:hypothetical protein